ncbi:MAG: diaminopimelate decarboxylase, partial [Chloroflexota bacterium]
ELHLIEEIGREKSITIPVGVRLNMAVGALPWDRFGFNLENGQALDACRRVMASSHLRLAGLHVHLGTFITDVNAYRWMAEQVASFCLHLSSEPGVALEYIDIGGGYASHNTLHQQWAPAQYTTPTFDQYAEAVCLALLRGPFRGPDVPLLLMEPGRALVDEAMYLVSSVVSTKMLPSDVKAVVIDAGVNLLPTSVWYRHQIQVVEEAGNLAEGSLLEEVNIYGPLCMQIDAIQFKVSLPPVRRGSLLVIKNVGAYNFSQSMQFIQPRPAVVLVNGGEVEYLRLPETTQYLQQLERVSERLLQRQAEG